MFLFNFVLIFSVFISSVFAQPVTTLPVPMPMPGSGLPPAAAYVPGNLLVKCKQFFEPCDLTDLHKKAKATVVTTFTYPVGLELLKVSSDSNTQRAMQVYIGDPRVEYVEPNYIVYALGLPNDTYFKYQWGLHNVGQTGGSIDVDINAPLAWDITTGSNAIALGTIDTGVDYTHPDLINNIWVNSQEIPGNGIDDDKNGYIDDVHGINAITRTGNPMDDNSHGTHVAGIMGAEGSNGFGISGVIQKTKIIACKFLNKSGSGDVASAITCMNYFAALATRTKDPVKVVATNNSWGGGNTSLAFQNAVKTHQQLGILFMAAASNSGDNNDVTASFPANITYSNVISVAATDSQDYLASFSNYGPHSVHVGAPGVDILSTFPKKVYNYLSGTSMATPFVTGLAGYIKASDPTMDWVSIKNLIIAGGEPTAAMSNSTISGRRIRMKDVSGQGSVSCLNQTITRRILPKANAYTMRTGQTLWLSVLKINCGKSTQQPLSMENVTVTAISAEPVTTLASLLNDQGQNGDEVAFDGVFTGAFKPAVAGNYRLVFSGADSVDVLVIN